MYRVSGSPIRANILTKRAPKAAPQIMPVMIQAEMSSALASSLSKSLPLARVRNRTISAKRTCDLANVDVAAAAADQQLHLIL
jgi:hypothetical protein